MAKLWKSDTFRLFILFWISIVIRLIPTRKWVYGMDEAMHLLEISFVLSRSFQGAKPGYSILLTTIVLFIGNQNPVFIRFLSIIFASFLVFVGYSFGKSLGGKHVGLWTAVFLTFHHRIFDMSYWIMTDIPFTFLSFLALYFIYRNFELLKVPKNGGKFAFLAGILCGISYLVRQLGIYLIILAIFLYFLSRGTSFSKRLNNAVTLFSGLFIMLIPWFLWNYIYHGVFDVTVNFVDISFISKFDFTLTALIWSLLFLGMGLCGVLLLIYKKIIFRHIYLYLSIICTTAVYALTLFLHLYFIVPNAFLSQLIYYLVQIPGFAVGFHLINPYGINYLAIIVSIITVPILFIGFMVTYKTNKSLTIISLTSSVFLILFLCIIIFRSDRYIFPMVPLLSSFLIVGVLRLKDIFFSFIAYPLLSKSEQLMKHFSAAPFLSMQIVTVSFLLIILMPNIVADGLADKYYLSFDEMTVTSPLWREYITAALWFRENSDQQAKVMTFKNFDFEYYSHRKCIPPHPQIYDEYYKIYGEQVYVTELMKLMRSHNITYIVFGPFGYSDRLLFWISDPITAPSYLDVIYLVDSPKVIIYEINWSEYIAKTPLD
ncbi:MAG: ArnT family glycosyltransferase [Promethearchaeota archaeon]